MFETSLAGSTNTYLVSFSIAHKDYFEKYLSPRRSLLIHFFKGVYVDSFRGIAAVVF